MQLLLDDTKNDVICLQETWYTKQDLQHLNDIHPDFHGTGVSTIDSRDGLIHGHPPGGVCIMWRGKFDRCVTPIEFDLDWLTGIYFCQDGRKYAVLCVYLPFECPGNEETYLEKLGVLQAILTELDTSCVSVLGDWNADISDANSMFATHLKVFCSDTGLILSDEAMLSGDTFTQLSERWHSTSWLDHCLSTSDGHNLITAVHVQYGTSCRDHIPVIVDISIESVPVLEDTVITDTTSRVDWDKLSVADKAAYANSTDTILSSVRVPIEAICCKDVDCEKVSHRDELSMFYNELVGAMSAASNQLNS